MPSSKLDLTNGDGGSIEQVLSSGDVHELFKVWEAFNRGETWRDVSATGSDQARAAAAQLLAEVREAAALEALRANAKTSNCSRAGAGM